LFFHQLIIILIRISLNHSKNFRKAASTVKTRNHKHLLGGFGDLSVFFSRKAAKAAKLQKN